MAKSKTVLPEVLGQGDKIKLVDSSWNILFPSYWLSYKKTASLVNITTIYVVEVLGKDQYLIGVMDIVPEEGRVVLPVGLKTKATLHQIHLALALTDKFLRATK